MTKKPNRVFTPLGYRPSFSADMCAVIDEPADVKLGAYSSVSPERMEPIESGREAREG
jgi:hypothetical protein